MHHTIRIIKQLIQS